MTLTTVAPINVEYLARGPNVSTACDSISPDVIENKPWEAISGMNNPLIVNFKKIDKDKLAIPAARPKRIIQHNYCPVSLGPPYNQKTIEI
ncbi:hypothetical protein BH23THE1_BH23THE1_13720 [soil metagenome]